MARQTAPAGMPASAVHEIKPGDTLSQIAFDRLKALGLPHSGRAVMEAVDKLARSNGIANPDRIIAGGMLRLDVLSAPPGVAPASPPPPPRPAAHLPAALGSPRAAQFPVLERTLDRAIQNGYLPPTDRGVVHEKIVSMAAKYRFSPDDFATVALMESDGLNPRASNGRCFGIIQFCGGSQAGAAAVGLAGAAPSIAERPVAEQLDLVDRYFEHNGLQRLPQVGLVDLYLTILTPAARGERSPAAPLPIPGTQARMLHENQDRSRPITRTSIVSGLLDHARQLLAGRGAPTGNASGKPGGNSLPLAQSQLPRTYRAPG